MDQFDPSRRNIAKLCQETFDTSRSPDTSRAALKSIANTLLLHSQARQTFVDIGYAGKVADRLKVNDNNREDEVICSRILFLLTYNTDLDFHVLFDDHALARNINNNISFHQQHYEELVSNNKEGDFDSRLLTETLKLLFNITKFYPNRAPAFTKSIEPILRLLYRIDLPTPSLQPPITSLINVLLNLDLPGEEEKPDDQGKKSTPLFPATSPARNTSRLISILEQGLRSEKDIERLEANATPLVSVLRLILAIAPPEVTKSMKSCILPSSSDRAQPLGRSDSLASQLLRLTTSPAAQKLKEQILYLLFELSDSDALTFTRNVGYGYAAGFLMTHNIPAPDSLGELDDKVTTVDGQEVNPITGQRRDMEPEDQGPEMTDEEKGREAEKLFVLFERLKATGLVNVVNPVEQAAREGGLEEVE